MRSPFSLGWLLAVVATALLLGAAAVAAQNGLQGPNERPEREHGEGSGTTLTIAQMVGQSPNDVMMDSETATAFENDRPLAEMIGRSPNGDTDVGDAVQAAPAAEAAPAAPAAISAASAGRLFLVTTTNIQGNTPLNACPAGFHMASIFELAGVTNLTYANIPDAKTQSDQGGGPVSGWWGWVRTGGDSSTTNQAGIANCAAWTSSESGHYGTIARLPSNWTSAATVISPWQSQTWSCSGIAPVWCVED